MSLSSTASQLWLMLPLCVAVAIVYKTVRTKNLRRLWLEILGVIAYIACGILILGVVLWLVQEYWP